MTTGLNPTQNLEPVDTRLSTEPESKLDQWLEKASGWFSPLLVKETRQALKSRQFVYTFFLLLCVVVVWLGLTVSLSTDLGSNAFSYRLFVGFLMILGFPLLIIIPFTAFRSLASEFEDGTLQLVSITTMRPYQIIIGKFGSAVLQMMIYLSILAPCIAFCYLLRGLDMRIIVNGLLLCVTSSICLTAIGLFFGSLSHTRSIGVGISVIFLFVLVLSFWFWIIFSAAGIYSLPQMLAQGGEVAINAFYSFFITFAILSFTVSAALLTFHADNRATAIRIALLLQQTVFIGWAISMVSFACEEEIWNALHLVFCHYWLFMGAMMSFVPAGLSQRVKRSLPKTMVSEGLFSLFMPGPGRGYFFAFANLLAGTSLFAILILLRQAILPSELSFTGGSSVSNFSHGEAMTVLLMLFLNTAYTLMFLGTVFLIGRWLNKRSNAIFPFAGLLISGLLIFGTIFLSIIIQFNLGARTNGYTLLQTFNWYWTNTEAISGGSRMVAFSLLVVTGLALITNFFACFIASKDLLERHASVPLRVQQDKQKAVEEVSAPPAGESIDEIFGKLPVRNGDENENENENNAEGDI